MLTATQLHGLNSPTKPRKLYDEKGLYLVINPSGRHYWRFRYRFNGFEKTLALGVYPDVRLAAARRKRDEARRLLYEHDIDPSAHRKAKKAARSIANAGTFKAIAEEWLEAGCPGPNRSKGCPSDGTIDLMRSRLKRFIYPRVGHLPLVDIELADLRAAITPISRCGKHDTAHRVRSLCERVWGYAMATDRATRNVGANLRYTIAPKPKSNGFAAILDPKRFGELLNAIEGYEGQPTTMLALRAAPLVFVRPLELRAAEWSEFDLDERAWSIPDRRMKEGLPHFVPLSKQAVSIFEEARDFSTGSKYVFPSLRSWKQPISDNTLNAALRRLGYSKEEMTAHGFRKSAATMLADLGFSSEWIETQLAHKRPGVQGIYNKSHLKKQRTEMMQAWADYIDELKTGAGN